MLTSSSPFAAYAAPLDGGWIHVCEVQPFSHNWPGMMGADVGIAYSCIEYSPSHSDMLIWPAYYWG